MLTNIVGEQQNVDCQSDHDPGNENRWRHQIDLPFQRSAMAKRAAGDRNRGHGTIMARRFDPGYRDTFIDGHGLDHRGASSGGALDRECGLCSRRFGIEGGNGGPL